MYRDNLIYFDNNATTAVSPEVFEAMRPFFCENYGNPSSIYTFGGKVKFDIEKARGSVAKLLGSTFTDREGHYSEIMFTSCGTESDSAAIYSALQTCPRRRKFVTTKIEHPAVLNLGKELERRGYKVSYVPVDSRGRIDMEIMKEQIDNDTAVVSVMWANNEVGNVFPVEEIAKLAHAKGALFHTDAVQAVGKIPMNMAESKIDLLSLSAHKLHGPKGVGALFIRKGIRFRPFLTGGHQEKGRRAGTENVAGIVGLGKAAELALEHLDEENTRVKALRDHLEEGIKNSIPQIRINGDLNSRLPNTSSISFEYIEGESILMLMDRLKICASSGSACTTGSLEPSHVLRSMGIPYTAAHGTIRFSLSIYNTKEEVDYVIKHMPQVVSTLRNMSPFWAE